MVEKDSKQNGDIRSESISIDGFVFNDNVVRPFATENRKLFEETQWYNRELAFISKLCTEQRLEY